MLQITYYLFPIGFCLFIFWLSFRFFNRKIDLDYGFISRGNMIFKNYGVVEIKLYTRQSVTAIVPSELFLYGTVTTKSTLELIGLETIFDKVDYDQTDTGLILTVYKREMSQRSTDLKGFLSRLDFILGDYANKHEEISPEEQENH